MASPYKLKLQGHALRSGRIGGAGWPYRGSLTKSAVCECGAQSGPLKSVAQRLQWHAQHKGDVKGSTLTTSELNDLAHEIAAEDSKSVISCATLTEARNGTAWFDLRSLDAKTHGYAAVQRAVLYLEAVRVLRRCPDDPQLVWWGENVVAEAPQG